MKRKVASWLVVLSAGALAACGDGGDDDGTDGPAMEPVVLGSGARCPDDGTDLTYENFAQGFFETYCTRCHSSELTSAERHGAPPGVNFDTLDGIHDKGAMEIDEKAVMGGEDAPMPFSEPYPSLADRRRLGEWLACGMK